MSSNVPEVIVTPSDIEVEKWILTSIVRSNTDLVRQLRPEDFHDSLHRQAFQGAIKCVNQGLKPDFVTIARQYDGEERQIIQDYLLDLHENHATGNLPYYVRLLKEKSLARSLQKAACRVVERWEPLEVVLHDLDAARAAAQAPNDFEKQVYIPNWDNIPPETPSILVLNGKKILSPGNLSLVIAGAGSGKSAVCEAICAASLTGEADSFNFTVNAPGLIFYVDTERSTQDHGRSWLRTMRRASIESGTIPGNLRFELISTLPSVETRRKYLSAVVSLPDLTLLLIDGLGDFVPDVNDAESSNAFLFWLLSEAKQKGFGILGTLHPNPADTDKKGRGHLGSEAMRRAESVLAIAKENDTRTLSMDFRYGKNRNDSDTASCSFAWNEDASMFLSCNKPEKKPAAQQRMDDLTTALRAKKTVYSFSELIDTIAEITGKPKTAARSTYQRLKTAGKLVQNGDLWGVISSEEW